MLFRLKYCWFFSRLTLLLIRHFGGSPLPRTLDHFADTLTHLLVNEFLLRVGIHSLREHWLDSLALVLLGSVGALYFELGLLAGMAYGSSHHFIYPR